MEYIDENGEMQYTGEETDTFASDGNLVSVSVQAPDTPNQADTRHVYVGRDSRGDVWQTLDEGGNVVEWASAPGAPSSNLIPGTVANLGAPSAMTAIQPTGLDFGQSRTSPVTPTVMPTNPIQPAQKPAGDPAHKYEGTDSRGDHYSLVDEGGRVISWIVQVNDDSRNMIPGTAAVVSQPAGSGMPAIPAAGTTSPSVPGGGLAVAGGDHIPDGPGHRYVGTDSQGDYYELTDAGGNVIRWMVGFNADSRNVIPGTLVNRGKPTDAPSTATGGSTSQGTGIPGHELINSPADVSAGAYGAPKQTDSRHKYVGRIGGRDYWQIFDGTNVIEWQVKAGDESGAIVAGTARNLGPPSSGTVAQNDGTSVVPSPAPLNRIPAGTNGPAVSDNVKNIALIALGAAGFALKIFK